jgi:hypothetical protein
MDRRCHEWRQGGVDELAALTRDAERAPEECLSRRRAEAHEHVRFDSRKLAIEPGPAGADLLGVRLLVDPPLSPRPPLEVLDDVRDVNLVAVDPCSLERTVQQLSRRADERPPLDVLAVAWLLADQHQLSFLAPLTEDRLGAASPQVAGAAVACRGSQLVERPVHGVRIPAP